MEYGCGLDLDQDTSQQLQSLDWIRHQETGCWTLDTPHGPARLVELTEQANWRHFELRGGALRFPPPRRLFAENYQLAGPVKYRAIGRQVACLADVPRATSGWDGHDVSMAHENPWQGWSRYITRLVRGEPVEAVDEGLGAAIPLETALGELQSAGWSASMDGGRLLVHLQLPGAYRQVRIESTVGGTCLAVDLLDYTGVSRLSLRAMARVAQGANARIPLVRLAVDERNQPTVLRAEVHLGRMPILGAWLSSAVDVLATAVALTARELEALRDPELAQVVLAAYAA
jgi:hypothetical protein